MEKNLKYRIVKRITAGIILQVFLFSNLLFAGQFESGEGTLADNNMLSPQLLLDQSVFQDAYKIYWYWNGYLNEDEIETRTQHDDYLDTKGGSALFKAVIEYYIQSIKESTPLYPDVESLYTSMKRKKEKQDVYNRSEMSKKQRRYHNILSEHLKFKDEIEEEYGFKLQKQRTEFAKENTIPDNQFVEISNHEVSLERQIKCMEELTNMLKPSSSNVFVQCAI